MNKTHTFKYMTILEYPDATENGLLISVFRDGATCDATRDSEMRNLDYARHLGYDNVRDALREHELAHAFISEKLWDSHSQTLYEVATGKGEFPYELQLMEEAVVLAFQYYHKKGEVGSWILLHDAISPHLEDWSKEFYAVVNA